ncbi:c-type cytochrome [Betaproteobacteria bacterium PRO4]|uniref:c-type cytochrome n=1 Tax=Nitrosomonas sp. TaxID=42353 RepID=UPI002563D698|nr:c-type cytochrome [Nitrosomonas sp.]MDL1866604.1 c-type cytochrome [Betaproteobacteria bacterium PRO4]
MMLRNMIILTSVVAAMIPVASPAQAVSNSATPAFVPPSESQIPVDGFGEMVRKGRDIFINTQANAREYVGNGLNCVNCHLDAGRRADSGPLWGAWGMYPAYRSKNERVNNFAERLQGCFEFSMNGKIPLADSDVILALSTYAYWMARGAPVGIRLPGAGYAKQDYEPPEPPDYERGKKVYEHRCALCHGTNGEGQKAAGNYVFPPLWGPESFNWGAGMARLQDAAAFIKVNMPLGLGGTLDDQDAWDIALYMNSHERPQDPRFTGDLDETRDKYHDGKWSLYGRKINGHLLGGPASAY